MKNMQSNIKSSDDEKSFLNNYLLYMLAHASEAVSREFHQQLSDRGVSVATWRVLACLYPDKAMNVGELARKCIIKQPTLTRQIDRLCEEGLTHRVHETQDRRGVLVSLTDAGKERAQEYIALAWAHENLVLQSYTAEEIAKLKSVLSLFAGGQDR